MYLVSRVHGVYVNLSILDEKGSKTYKKRKSPIGLGSIHSNGLLLFEIYNTISIVKYQKNT